MTDEILVNLKEWAQKNGHDGAKLEASLVSLADEFSIALKLYDGDRLTRGEAERNVLDVRQVLIQNVKGTSGRSVDIAPGATLVYGPNDAGKTTLQVGAMYAIGGRGAVDLEDDRLIRAGADQMVARVNLEGERFIQRSLGKKVAKRGKDAGVTKIERQMLVRLNGHEEDKLERAQLEIDTYLGGDSKLALTLAFMRQGMITGVMSEKPADRKKALYDLLGLGSAEETRDKLSKAMRAIEERAVAKAPDERVAQIQKRIEEIQSDRCWLTPDAATESEGALPSARAELLELQQRAAVQKDRTDDIRDRWFRVRDLPPTCATCAELGKTCELTPELKVARLEDIQKAGQKSKADHDQLLAAAKEKQAAVDTLEADAREARDARARKAAAQSEIANLKRELAELAKQAEDKKSALCYDADVVSRLVEAFGKDGMPKMLAQGHIARINAIAKQLCADDRYTYQFGEEDFDIEFYDSKQEDASIAPVFASGSSRERGAVVLLAARSLYLQELTGLKIPFLWIDELSFQDDANKLVVAKLIAVLSTKFTKVILNASDWDGFFIRDATTGERLCLFDNQIALMPDDVSKALDEQRAKSQKLAEEGQGTLSPPAPEVKTYDSKGPLPPPAPIPPSIQSMIDNTVPPEKVRDVDLEREVAEIKQKVDRDLAEAKPNF